MIDKYKILAVEGNAECAKWYADLFAEHDVHIVSSGSTGIDKIRSMQSFDIVILE